MRPRIYALTGGNRLIGGLLFVLIFAQLCFGVYFLTKTAMSPGKFLGRWFFHVLTSRSAQRKCFRR
jgi:hypothetical protein